MIGSMHVNGSDDSDAQLLISDDECADGELRLTIVNNDEEESASLFVNEVDLLDLLERIKQAIES